MQLENSKEFIFRCEQIQKYLSLSATYQSAVVPSTAVGGHLELCTCVLRVSSTSPLQTCLNPSAHLGQLLLLG